MSIRAQRISFGLAVLPFVCAALISLATANPAVFVVATSFMVAVFAVVAHLIVAPIASFVGGLEKVTDPAGAPAEVLAAPPPEPVAVLALVALDTGNAIQQAASDAAEAFHSAASSDPFLSSEAGRPSQLGYFRRDF